MDKSLLERSSWREDNDSLWEKEEKDGNDKVDGDSGRRESLAGADGEG